MQEHAQLLPRSIMTFSTFMVLSLCQVFPINMFKKRQPLGNLHQTILKGINQLTKNGSPNIQLRKTMDSTFGSPNIQLRKTMDSTYQL